MSVLDLIQKLYFWWTKTWSHYGNHEGDFK